MIWSLPITSLLHPRSPYCGTSFCYSDCARRGKIEICHIILTGLHLLLIHNSINILLNITISSYQLLRKFRHIERHIIRLLVLINIIILLPTEIKGMNTENLKEKI